MPNPSVPLAVLTPSGFAAFSAEGQVLLSWNQTPQATSYVIRRSTDNVTFADLATTAGLTYSDLSGTLGTIYYYQVQAANAGSYGNPAASLAGMSLSPGQTTLGNMRLEAQQRCNKEKSQFYTTQEWNSMLSQSYKELFDILAQKFGDDYFVAVPYTYTLAGGQQMYPLPLNHYKLLGVEVALNPNDPNSWITIREFNFVQRNLYNSPNIYNLRGVTNLRYRLNGNNLMLAPFPTGGQTLRIWYVPRPSQLINDTDTVDAVSGWEEYIVADACIKALGKEESDVQLFMAQKAALLKRIEEAAENRNISEPETVSDVRRANFNWGQDMDGGWY